MMQVVLHYLTCCTFLGVSDSLLFSFSEQTAYEYQQTCQEFLDTVKDRVPPSTTPEKHFTSPSGEHEGLWSMQWV